MRYLIVRRDRERALLLIKVESDGYGIPVAARGFGNKTKWVKCTTGILGSALFHPDNLVNSEVPTVAETSAILMMIS